MKAQTKGAGALVVALIAGWVVFGAIAHDMITGESDTPTVITEDSAGWDALRMGNRAGVVDGVLVVAVDDMPTDPYDRCMYLLDISARVKGLPYDAAALCDPIKENR